MPGGTFVLHGDRSRTQQRRGNRPGNTQKDRQPIASTKATLRTFVQMQSAIDQLLYGSLYAGHCADSEGQLLQMLQPDYIGIRKKTKIKEGKFKLSQESIMKYVENREERAAADADLKNSTVTSKPFSKSITFTLTTSASLSAGAKLSAAGVPVTIGLSGSTAGTTCATIHLNDVVATKLEDPTHFLKEYFRKPSSQLVESYIQRGITGPFLKVFVVTTVYHGTFNIEMSTAWEQSVGVGLSNMPPIALEVVGARDGNSSASNTATQKRLIAVRVMTIEYDVRSNVAKRGEGVIRASVPRPECNVIFDDNYKTLFDDDASEDE